MHSKITVCGIAALATQVVAHGYVRTITLDGVDYNGYSNSDGSPKANTIGWSFTTNNEGPEMDLSSNNFICRSGGQSASSSGQVAAGGQASFFWTSDDENINPDGWAKSHQGPIMTYIAPCGGDCSSVDPSSLRWTKIAEKGVTGPANTQGTWATDEMRANGGVTTATIPSSIAPGNYVLRNEIIALHKAHEGQPEFYPQCGNIQVTGSGTDTLSGAGVAASRLYSTSDSQIFGFSIYDNNADGSSWVVPGPPLYAGAGSSSGAAQSNGSTGGNLGSGSSGSDGSSSTPQSPSSGSDPSSDNGSSYGSPPLAGTNPSPPASSPETVTGPPQRGSYGGHRGGRPHGGPRGYWRPRGGSHRH